MGDIYANYDRIDRTFQKLEESQLSEPNKEVLKEFVENLMAENLSDHKIYRYIQTFRVLGHEIDFRLVDAEKKDLIRLVGKINQNNIEGKDYSPQSKLELKKAIKKFYKWHEETEHPDKLEFMSMNIKASNRKKIDASKLPTYSDVQNIVETAENPRDKAMFMLLWESGARAGELLQLDWSDIREDGDFYRVDLDGKTGQRTVPVVESIPHLDRWESFQQDREPVFTSFQGGSRCQYRAVYKQLKEVGERAGIERKTNPHAFRKSRATYLASEGANVFQLMEFFGWKKAETAKTYVRLAKSDVDKLVRDVHL